MSRRAGGVLLHPTSLPGGCGIGDFGAEARRFVDRLADAGASVWQMLPVTAPGSLASPYDGPSAFAGNWLLISVEDLADAGWLPSSPRSPRAPTGATDLPLARKHKDAILRSSWRHFRGSASRRDRERLERFRHGEDQRFWLDDWTLFGALSSRLGGAWTDWPLELRQRDPAALDRARSELAEEIEYESFRQFLFFDQFAALRRHAEERGVRLCGDVPIYVSHESSDVWARPELFDLDADGRPLAVAGVPPDAFTPDGQLWGSPLYLWPRHRESGFRWWTERLRHQQRLADILRLDHFRGFVAYFRVPADAADARSGRWRRGPGRRLFSAAAAELGHLDLIAEDLGVITPAVRRLRDRLGLPGMKVLQFGFGEEDSEHLPHHHCERSVAYSGTHDNDTLVGWIGSLAGEERRRLLDYLGLRPTAVAPDVARHLIRVTLQSVAELAVVPMQDLLGLGSEARMNTPGQAHGNWLWRMLPDAFDDFVVGRLRGFLAVSGRRVERGGPIRA